MEPLYRQLIGGQRQAATSRGRPFKLVRCSLSCRKLPLIVSRAAYLQQPSALLRSLAGIDKRT
jgi:hypothetical protein